MGVYGPPFAPPFPFWATTAKVRRLSIPNQPSHFPVCRRATWLSLSFSTRYDYVERAGPQKADSIIHCQTQTAVSRRYFAFFSYLLCSFYDAPQYPFENKGTEKEPEIRRNGELVRLTSFRNFSGFFFYFFLQCNIISCVSIAVAFQTLEYLRSHREFISDIS